MTRRGPRCSPGPTVQLEDQPGPILNYRIPWSGITRANLSRSKPWNSCARGGAPTTKRRAWKRREDSLYGRIPLTVAIPFVRADVGRRRFFSSLRKAGPRTDLSARTTGDSQAHEGCVLSRVVGRARRGSVVCGNRETPKVDSNVVVNPSILVEVTSKATEDYDRGDKLSHSEQIPSLRAVLLVSHRLRPRSSSERGPLWCEREARGGERVTLATEGIDFAVDDVYKGLTLDPA